MPTIDLGDPIPDLTFQVYTPNGSVADAGAVSLTITKPDNTTDTPMVSHDGLGQYSAYYVPATAGHYLIRWVATGDNAAAQTDSFDVLESNPRYIVSLADAKALLRFNGTPESDDEIRRYSEAATHIVERYLDQTVVRKTITGERHRISGTLFTNWYPECGTAGCYRTSVFLDTRPIISLTSMATVDGLYTWDTSLIDVNQTTGELTPKPGSPGFWGNVINGYVAGYQVIPANYQEAARIIIQHLWATRRGLAGNLITQQLPGFNIGFALPQSAKDLLGEQPPVFA